MTELEAGPITQLKQAEERIQGLMLGLGVMDRELDRVEKERDELREALGYGSWEAQAKGLSAEVTHLRGVLDELERNLRDA